ncbi:MAG: hypothetical protein U9N07_00080 [Euryarchaeota archaeon]|nr:hypothetical protein [Euryarchaeota archaeon]
MKLNICNRLTIGFAILTLVIAAVVGIYLLNVIGHDHRSEECAARSGCGMQYTITRRRRSNIRCVNWI